MRKLLLATALLACAGGASSQPDASLSPSDVVRLQLEALAREGGSEGIAVAFRFASPANKQVTGPLERFIDIVRAPAYRPMLGHVEASLGPVHVDGSYAAQAVEIVARDGSRHAYLFELSRQQGGRFEGCWMTDSVVRLRSEPEPGTAI